MDNRQERKKVRKDYTVSNRESEETQSNQQNTSRSYSNSSNVMCLPLTEFNIKRLEQILKYTGPGLVSSELCT